jgi:tRNA nucleotidyltransferase/poly(A) polymerase
MDNPFPVLESIDKRLHFDSALRKHLLAVSAILAQINALVNKKPSRWVAFLDEFPLKAVQAAWLALPSGQAREGLYAYLETWRQIKPRISGHDLKERGQQPGPGYQSILRGLRDAWLDGKVKTNAEEMALLEKLIKKK